MVKRGWFPTRSDMAGFTGCTFCAGMLIILLVAANTSGSRTLILKRRDMTFLTIKRSMLTIQFKNRTVIKRGGFPTSAHMAGFTCVSFCASMFVIFLMATHASGGSAFKLERCGVALLAIKIGMLALQFEHSCMLKCGWLPPRSVMTCFTGSPLGTSVFIILLVAFHTGGWSAFKLMRHTVTILASHFFVLTI